MPPLPPLAAVVTPVARVTASTIDRSPRDRIRSPDSTSTLAGVSRTLMPSRLPVAAGLASCDWRPVTSTPSTFEFAWAFATMGAVVSATMDTVNRSAACLMDLDIVPPDQPGWIDYL